MILNILWQLPIGGYAKKLVGDEMMNYHGRNFENSILLCHFKIISYGKVFKESTG